MCGLDGKITVQNADTNDPADPLRDHNPLGKIPALVLDDGRTVFDSRVIVEWMDEAAGGRKIIPVGENRISVLIGQALADGIMDASLAIIYEMRFRPEALWHQPWMDRQAEKVSKGLAAFQAAPPDLSATPQVDAIALACALGYRDFRFTPDWRTDYPGLAEWLVEFSNRVPAFGLTAT